MGTISFENEGIISLFYGKLSFLLKMMKLKEKEYGDKNVEWIKSLVIDKSLKYLYEIYEKPTEQQQQTFRRLFGQIFGQSTFSYGFVANNQIYLFSNQNEKLITFSSNFTRNNDLSKQKYPFNIQSYQDFFHCNRPLDSDKKTTSNTATTVVKQRPSSPKKTTKIKSKITKLPKTTTTTVPSNEQQQSKFPFLSIMIIIILSILLLIGMMVCFQSQKSVKKPVSSSSSSSSSSEQQSKRKFPLDRYGIEKQQNSINDEKKSNLIKNQKSSPTTTRRSAATETEMNEKSIPDSTEVNEQTDILYD
ncbi:uncharacterized protein LOC142646034 [Dermatophagoides pteronyssinus]|uniref:uncharacterized protein LOC142646034 n=1 Tax=Dermatophagoides pteronyssinus TaxID=6956 RepID=UPI003F662061